MPQQVLTPASSGILLFWQWHSDWVIACAFFFQWEYCIITVISKPLILFVSRSLRGYLYSLIPLVCRNKLWIALWYHYTIIHCLSLLLSFTRLCTWTCLQPFSFRLVQSQVSILMASYPDLRRPKVWCMLGRGKLTFPDRDESVSFCIKMFTHGDRWRGWQTWVMWHPPPHCFSLLDFHVGSSSRWNIAVAAAPRMSAVQGVSMFAASSLAGGQRCIVLGVRSLYKRDVLLYLLWNFRGWFSSTQGSHSCAYELLPPSAA